MEQNHPWAMGRFSMPGKLRRRGGAFHFTAFATIWLCRAPSAAAADTSRIPRISFLDIRCTDRPIDLEPKFDPGHYVYSATMDYSMSSFAVDAVPARGMDIVGLDELLTTKLVSPGATHRVDIRVRDPQSQNEMQYTVTVTRLDGTDVSIRAMNIDQATITPLFDPAVLTYSVQLPAIVDHVRLQLAPRDSGQTIQVYATPSSNKESGAVSQTASTTTAPMTSETTAPVATLPPALMPQTPVTGENSRRLQNGAGISSTAVGEIQMALLQKRFPVDVGQGLTIQVKVLPANGDITNSATYKLIVSRAACPSHRPFYAPDLHQCAETCDDGFFRATTQARCEACAPLCQKCSAWDRCDVCEPSQYRTLKIISNSNGHCKRLRIPWIPIGVGTAGAVILLSVCCCVMRGPDTSRPSSTVFSKRRGLKVMDSDNEYGGAYDRGAREYYDVE